MKLRALLFAVVLAGCQPIAPGPARYSCSRELPAESQCASGWRCGLEGFCFDPRGSSAVTLSCEAPETDCPTGWKCSLEGTCFDPALTGAGSLPCRDPLAHCPTGWKCGLDARCLAPDVAGPWRCEETARDCTGGWSCGARGLCFDRADAGRVACRGDVATDCGDGWRCGIDGLCQQLDAGAPWPCRDDTHCEAAWRCSPEGQCLDPSADALRANDGAPGGVRFDLGLPVGTPDEVSLEDRLHRVGCMGQEVQALSGAARFGRRVELFAVAPRGGRGLPLTCDGGTPGSYGPVLRGHVDFPNDPPLELAQFRHLTLVRVDGGVRRFALSGDQEVTELPFIPGQFKKLRKSLAVAFVAAFGDQDVVLINTSASAPLESTGPLRAVDGGTAIISDVVIQRSGPEEVFLAATDQGLFAKLRADQSSPWTHVVWNESRAPMPELHLSPLEDGGQSLTALARSNGTRAWTFHVEYEFNTLPRGVFETGVSPGRMYLQDLPSTRGVHRFEWAENFVMCPGEGEVRGWLQAVDRPQLGNTKVLSFLQCGLGDGGTELRRTVVDAFSNFSVVAPGDEVAPMTSTTRWRANDDRSVVMFDEAGGLWLASTRGRTVLIDPWVPVVAPRAVTGRLDEALTLRTAQAELLLGDAVPQARTREAHFVSRADGGFLKVDATLDALGNGYRLVAGIEGRADLAVVELPTPQGNSVVLVQADDAGTLGLERSQAVPAFAKATPSRQQQVASVSQGAAGGLWFISVGDQLHFTPLGAAFAVRARELSQFPDLGPLPAARLALTPQPGATLTHVLGLPADAASGASYGQALVVAAGRLLHVRAENPVVWRSSEPVATPAEIVKSWSDGARVRIGDREGRVTSFPSRVSLSAPLGANKQAWDFVDVCGVTYALASDGLWRLAARPGKPVGAWAPVPVPGGFSFTAASTLYTDGTGLLVFDGRGRATRITALTCAQPL